MINENFVILGAIICLLGGISYIKDTISGKIQPNRISWGFWGLAVMIAFAAEIKQGVGFRSLATFMVGFIPILIFFASFVNKKAYWKLTNFDALCGLLAISGIILWYITKNPNLAITFSIIADLAAGIPTLVKSWQYPETENWIEFLGSAINVFIVILTLRIFSFAFLAFPLYILCFDLLAFFLVKFKLGKYFKTLTTK